MANVTKPIMLDETGQEVVTAIEALTSKIQAVVPDVSGKINEPATEGTSGQVLTTDGQGGRNWADIEKAPVTISGTTPTITALSGIQYVCGEVATLDITLPASGIVDVVFTSGSTPTVLTVTPPSGMTMKWANGFDPDNLEADTVYEINVLDGCLGVGASWT